jgi:hypothetical protein
MERMTSIQQPSPPAVISLRAFVPAKDFEASLRFYQEHLVQKHIVHKPSEANDPQESTP